MTKFLIERREMDIVWVTLNRPEHLDYEMMNDLEHALQEIRRDMKIKGVVITGNGRPFCSGGI